MTVKKDNNYNVVLNQLLINGIVNFSIIDLFMNTNKDDFLPNPLKGLSGCDCIIYFKKDRFVLENSSLLFMLQIANLKKEDNILVIGADLGFSLYLLANLAKTVTCVEEDQAIITETTNNLENAKVTNVNIIQEKFKNGIFNKSPFDCIIVNGAFLKLPANWSLQLANNKSIVGIQRENNLSQIVKITKKNDNLEWQYYKHCGTPYLKGLDKDNNFVF